MLSQMMHFYLLLPDNVSTHLLYLYIFFNQPINKITKNTLIYFIMANHLQEYFCIDIVKHV